MDCNNSHWEQPQENKKLRFRLERNKTKQRNLVLKLLQSGSAHSGDNSLSFPSDLSLCNLIYAKITDCSHSKQSWDYDAFWPMYELLPASHCVIKKICTRREDQIHLWFNPHNLSSLFNKNSVGAFISERRSAQWEKTEWRKNAKQRQKWAELD